MRGLVPLWLLVLAVLAPGSILIVQQWTLGERLARLQSHEQFSRIREAVDAIAEELITAFRGETDTLARTLLEPVQTSDAVAGRVPPPFRELSAVRGRIGRPMVVFVAVPAGEGFAITYYTLDDEDQLVAFKQPQVEATHRALLTYIHSLGGQEDLQHRRFATAYYADTARSPLGPVHFFHLALYGTDPFTPRAYVGCWETLDFAFRSFCRPFLEGSGLSSRLARAGLNPEAFQFEVLTEFGDRLFVSGEHTDVEAALDVRMSAYGPVFEPYTLRMSKVRGLSVSPAQAVRTQNLLLLGLAGGLLAAGGAFLARSVSRDRWLAKTHTDFVAQVSHELKTPVAVLLNAVETMKNPKVTDPVDQARCVSIVHDRVRDLARLLERLLDVCRVDADRLPVARKPVDICVYLERGLPRLCEMAGLDPRRLTTRLEAAATGAVVLADEGALELIMRNLLENVVKHGGGAGEVGCRGGRRFVRVWVRDLGPGIARREQARIFRRFYRVEDSMKASTPGHGLGLALVKALVEAHGGRVGVESEPGRGAMFFFDLPLEMSA